MVPADVTFEDTFWLLMFLYDIVIQCTLVQEKEGLLYRFFVGLVNKISVLKVIRVNAPLGYGIYNSIQWMMHKSTALLYGGLLGTKSQEIALNVGFVSLADPT